VSSKKNFAFRSIEEDLERFAKKFKVGRKVVREAALLYFLGRSAEFRLEALGEYFQYLSDLRGCERGE
jgi:hypothetical protein